MVRLQMVAETNMACKFIDFSVTSLGIRAFFLQKSALLNLTSFSTTLLKIDSSIITPAVHATSNRPFIILATNSMTMVMHKQGHS